MNNVCHRFTAQTPKQTKIGTDVLLNINTMGMAKFKFSTYGTHHDYRVSVSGLQSVERYSSLFLGVFSNVILSDLWATTRRWIESLRKKFLKDFCHTFVNHLKINFQFPHVIFIFIFRGKMCRCSQFKCTMIGCVPVPSRVC